MEVDPSTMPADLAPLYPAEAAAMARAVDKRRREFTAGRVLVRRAMQQLGLPQAPLLNGEDRAPRWPDDVVGSITHTAGICAVAVAARGEVLSIGIDAEQDEPLKPELWDTICTPRDLAWLAGQDTERRGELAKAIFSAKECAYKAQYLLTQQYLGFHAMSVELSENTWRATFETNAGMSFGPGDVLEGRWRRARGVVATAIVLRRP